MSTYERVERDGHVYHIEDGHSFGENSSFVWKEKLDKKSNKLYYTNLGTGDKKWSLPSTSIPSTTSKKALKSASSTLGAASLQPSEPLAAPFNFPGALLAFNPSEPPAANVTKTPLKKSSSVKKKTKSQPEEDDGASGSTLKRKTSKKGVAATGEADGTSTTTPRHGIESDEEGEGVDGISAVGASGSHTTTEGISEAPEEASSKKKLKKSSSKLKPKKKKSAPDATDGADALISGGKQAENNPSDADSVDEDHGEEGVSSPITAPVVMPSPTGSHSAAPAVEGVSDPPQSPKKKLKKSSSKLKPKKKSAPDATGEVDASVGSAERVEGNDAGDGDTPTSEREDGVNGAVGDAPQMRITSPPPSNDNEFGMLFQSQIVHQDDAGRANLSGTPAEALMRSSTDAMEGGATPRRASRQVSFVGEQGEPPAMKGGDKGSAAHSGIPLPPQGPDSEANLVGTVAANIIPSEAHEYSSKDAIRRAIARDLIDDEPTDSAPPSSPSVASSPAARVLPSWSDLRASFASIVAASSHDASREHVAQTSDGDGVSTAVPLMGVQVEAAEPIVASGGQAQTRRDAAQQQPGVGVRQQQTARMSDPPAWNLEDARRGSGMTTMHVDPLDPSALTSPLNATPSFGAPPSTTRRYVLPAAVPGYSSPAHHDDEQLTPFRVRIADDASSASSTERRHPPLNERIDEHQPAVMLSHRAVVPGQQPTPTAPLWMDDLQPRPRPSSPPHSRSTNGVLPHSDATPPPATPGTSIDTAPMPGTSSVQAAASEERNSGPVTNASTAQHMDAEPAGASTALGRRSVHDADVPLSDEEAADGSAAVEASSSRTVPKDSSAGNTTAATGTASSGPLTTSLRRRRINSAAPLGPPPPATDVRQASLPRVDAAATASVARRQQTRTQPLRSSAGGAGRVVQTTPRYPSSFAPHRTASRSPEAAGGHSVGGGSAGTSRSGSRPVASHAPSTAMGVRHEDLHVGHGIQRGTTEHLAMAVVESGFVHCSRNVGKVPSGATAQAIATHAEANGNSAQRLPQQQAPVQAAAPSPTSIVIYANSPPRPSSPPAAGDRTDTSSHRQGRAGTERLPRRRAASSDSDASTRSERVSSPQRKVADTPQHNRRKTSGVGSTSPPVDNIHHHHGGDLRSSKTHIGRTHPTREEGHWGHRAATATLERAAAANRVLQSALTSQRLHANTCDFPSELRPFLLEQEVHQLRILQNRWHEVNERVSRLRRQIAQHDDNECRGPSTSSSVELEAMRKRQAILDRNLMRTQEVQWRYHLAQLGGASS